MKMPDDRDFAYWTAEHQANLIRLAQTWAAELRDKAASTDNALLGALADFLDVLGAPEYSEQAQRRYLDMQRQILAARAKSFSAMLDYMTAQCEMLTNNEIKWSAAFVQKLAPKGTISKLAPAQLKNLVKFADVKEGMTLAESVRRSQEEDARRIANICREGMRRGKTVEEISKELRGTKSARYEDGALATTRRDAEQIARTTCCGIADEAKMQFYLANADVIKGVRHVATLSGNTCLVCGAYDGMVWRIPEDVHLIPKLGIHQNCRCVHLPVTDMDDIATSTRPAEVENFWKEAETAYGQKHPDKDWNKLARSTRLKYYYEAQKEYEKRTGKPAFDQVPQNMSFKDWLNTKDDKYLRAYFGKTRYELYKNGKLPLDKFVNPETNRAFTILELKTRDIEAFKKAGLTNHG